MNGASGTNPADLTPDQQAFIGMLAEDAHNRYLDGDPTALERSVALKPHDRSFWMLLDKTTSTPVVHRDGCYICEDPEYAAMGLPLCMRCTRCGGHVAADDDVCDDCGACINPYTQWDADGLAPDGFQELDPMGDGGGWLGDFETSEPFTVVTGQYDDGRPVLHGDLRETRCLGVGDYVESLTEAVRWRGTVTEIETRPVTYGFGKKFDEFIEGYAVSTCTVRVDEPRGGRRQLGDLVHAYRPEWLLIIRRNSPPPPWEK